MDDQQYTADAIRVLQEVAQTSGGPLSAEEQTVLASRNGVAIGRYAQTVIKGRWADAERLLLKHAGSISLVQYAEKVIKGRWPEAEKRIISDSRKMRWILRYARKCVKGRWQEAEQRLLAGGKRPPQPALTALIASRVDTFQPVFKEATHGSTGRPEEVRGMAATAAAVHSIRHDCVQVLRSGGRIGRHLPLLASEARARAV